CPFSPGPDPTSGRAALPEPRKKARSPDISSKRASHSRRSSLRNVLLGALEIRRTSPIRAELVEMAEERKIPPSSLLLDQSGTLVAVSRTPVYPPRNMANRPPGIARSFCGSFASQRAPHHQPNSPSLAP